MVALALLIGLFFHASCDPLSSLIGGGFGKATVDSAVTGVNEAIERVHKALDEQRGKLKLDVLEVLDRAVRDAERLAHDAANLALLVEGKAAADLGSMLSQTTAALDRMAGMIANAAGDAILAVARETSNTLEKAANQARDLAHRVRPIIDRAEHAAGATIRRVENMVVTAVIAIAALAILLVCAIMVLRAAIKRRWFGAGGWAAVGGAVVAGVLLLVFASPLSRLIAGDAQEIPDPGAACTAMSRDGLVLQQQLAPAISFQVSAHAGRPLLDRPAEADLRALERALRGAARSGLVSRADQFALGRVPGRIQVLARPGFSIPHYLPGLGQLGPPIVISQTGGLGTSPPKRRMTDAELTALAEQVRDAASTCSVFSASSQQIATAERYYTMAASYLGEPIVCVSSNQCASQQRCDILTGECLALGVYCEDPMHCGDGSECDMAIKRCTPRTNYRCSTTQPCRAGEYCNNSQCLPAQQVIGRPCTILGARGPCQKGSYADNGAGALTCRETFQRSVDNDCDQVDDDCDGFEDNAFVPGSCSADAPGVCAAGKQVCTAGGPVCEPGPPQAEVCGNQIDEDCDHRLDNAGCPPFEEPNQEVGCGWGCRKDVSVGGDCRQGHTRLECRVDGPQDETAHAQFTGWENDNPNSCRCKIHAGTWGARSAKWMIKISSLPGPRSP